MKREVILETYKKMIKETFNYKGKKFKNGIFYSRNDTPFSIY